MKITQEELKTALELHKKWLHNEEDGEKLNLNRTNLRRANLSFMNLTCADFSGADLSGADLRGTDFSETYFCCTDLSDANFSGSNLSGADLRWANTNETTGLDVICVQLNTSSQNRQIQYYVQLRKVTAGCFSGTIDELKKAVREKHDKDSVIYKRYQIAFKTIEDILETY